ncbi:inositol 1,4,5-trisphosphate receptor-interacting protein-like 1 [Pelodiscus sinensis]|nr:inositol 1,4,5-trisphosphate receptor-interacting protein-like 1 [Pelodiscus sinensis]XP_025043476.1 inositol 1,4,5-trisphosphate receptor-interacting protein-like 1 [Pelodiscus sinensis]|eukprot:XP_006129012.1 inositol 1,4,5-trisphosphate receptor-interacting protein-like 1 [Pelodiscus sinensis]
MAVGSLLFLAVLAIVYHPMMVSDNKQDPMTVERVQQQEQLLALEMNRLQLEFEQRNQEQGQGLQQSQNLGPNQSQGEEGAALKVESEQGPEEVAWHGWHCGVLVIILLFELCRPSMEHESSYDSSSDDASSVEEEEEAETAPRSVCTQHPDFPDTETLEHFYEQHLQGTSKELASTCEFVTGLVNSLLEACRVLICQTFLPQLENCIGVASAFEGWCPHRDSKTYCVLVPLLPPKGHSFHLEMDYTEGTPENHGHILVELECVCKRERLLGDVLCLLHHSEADMSDSKRGPFRVHILCSSSHLDVEKTTHWFQSLIGKAWELMSHNYSFQLSLQPSTSCCKLWLAYESGRALSIEIILGVQRGDSLVFLASQGAEMGHSSGLAWLETFAVQEMLFFQLMSRYAPQDSCHLKCLQILIYLKECRMPTLENKILTTYHFKTALMHLLLLLPLSEWCPEQLAQRLQDILLYLHHGLEEKCLYHFLIGNSALPRQIPVPKAFQNAKPLNLFQHLALEPAAHAQARSEFLEVMEQVRALLPQSSK